MTNAELIKQVPHDKLVQFKKTYDGFEKKDMPFADFVCALMNLTDQKKMESDLEGILSRKAIFAHSKSTIDGAG